MSVELNHELREFPVTVYGSLEKYSSVTSKARCRIFYKGLNRNGTFISDEFANKLLKTISYTPVKGIYDGDDYTDHGSQRSFGKIYGIVPENPNLVWEEHMDEDGVLRQYACVDVLLFTALYEEAGDIIGKAQSMELYDKSIEGDWKMVEGKKCFEFTEATFLGLQVLGEEVEPCFEGAAFFSLYNSITEMIEKIEQYNLNLENNRQGGKKMPTMNFKLSDQQKYGILWNLLNPNFNEENNWTVEYSLGEVYDSYAVACHYNGETSEYVRVYYTKDAEAETVTIDKVEPCYIVDVSETEKIALEALQKLNGNFEKVDELYSSVETLKVEKEELNSKINEYTETISTLETERDEAHTKYEEANSLLEEAKASLEEVKANLATLDAEKNELVEYKKGIELSEKQAVVNSYSELLAKEVLDQYSENLDKYSVVELDKELAYELKNSNPTVFSHEKSAQYLLKVDAPKTGIESILSKYSK